MPKRKKKDHEGRVVQLDAIMFSVGGTFNEYLNGKVCIFCTVYNVMWCFNICIKLYFEIFDCSNFKMGYSAAHVIVVRPQSSKWSISISLLLLKNILQTDSITMIIKCKIQCNNLKKALFMAIFLLKSYNTIQRWKIDNFLHSAVPHIVRNIHFYMNFEGFAI